MFQDIFEVAPQAITQPPSVKEWRAKKRRAHEIVPRGVADEECEVGSDGKSEVTPRPITRASFIIYPFSLGLSTTFFRKSKKFF